MTDAHPGDPRPQRLQPAQIPDWLAAHPHALLLDARDAVHHAQSHLAGAIRLDGRNHESLLLREPKDRPVLISCYHGHASQTWAAMFTDFGFARVVDVVGGWRAIDPGAQLIGPQIPLQVWLSAEGFSPTRPDLSARHGNTPLMHAAWRGAHAVVAELLALGADPHLQTQDGFSALDMAATRECLQLLRAATRRAA